VYWAAEHAQKGWKCANADLLKDIVSWIKFRSAPVQFFHVKAHSGNGHNDAADAAAKSGAQLHLTSDVYVPCEAPLIPLNAGGPVLHVKKVFCDLEEVPKPVKGSEPANSSGVPLLGCHYAPHHGRALHHAVQRANLKRLTDVSSNSAAFWKVYRELVSPRKRAPLVSLSQLAACFEKRMNAPEPPPPSFNIRLMQAAEERAKAIPVPSVDRSPDQTFSGRIVAKDLEWAKEHLKSHSRTAAGLDRQHYDRILGIDNEVLCRVINECINRNDAPSVWLTTLIAAIPKKDKPLTDAKSYRTVGLESCFLKLICLLIHKRIYDWAEARGIIPASQNGFRKTYRTNNNTFVLRCMIERARAEGRTLWVAFLDITNAFPSTNRNLLWVKLYNLGISGKLFDWMRMLYGKMEYVVTQGGQYSEPFTSNVGVLIGDPMSLTLWDIFFADFNLHPDDADVLLCGVIMSHLEHADDMAIVSYSPEGLQRHLNTFIQWCGDNLLDANAEKSWIMIFGPVPSNIPMFTLNGNLIEYRDRHTYVGITFQSTERNIFAANYTEKAKVARGTCYSVLGIEAYTGDLPPREGRLFYMACVDPHLISGADIVVDVTDVMLLELEKVQLNFLRRLLGLGAHSIRAPLFTELGVIPIRYRRLMIALRFLEGKRGYWMDLRKATIPGRPSFAA
jgi:hypothetical protein